MSLPSELKLPAAIEMMCMTSKGPKVLAGCISATGPQGIVVDASGPFEDVLPGSKVVLSSSDKAMPRISATVVLCKGNRLTLSEPATPWQHPVALSRAQSRRWRGWDSELARGRQWQRHELS